jgi:hypothetical protein
MGEIAYGEKFRTSPTQPGPSVCRKSTVAWGSRTSAATHPANSPTRRQSRRPTNQIPARSGKSLMFAASAIPNGLPIASSSVTTACAWATASVQAIGKPSTPTAIQVSRRRRPITYRVATKAPTTTVAQIAAATSKGRRASGRNRIAKSGG